MTVDTLTKHISCQTMELKDVNLCTSFVSTIWRDKPVMIMYDNLNSKILDTWFNPVLQEGDLKFLTDLVRTFLN